MNEELITRLVGLKTDNNEGPLRRLIELVHLYPEHKNMAKVTDWAMAKSEIHEERDKEELDKIVDLLKNEPKSKKPQKMAPKTKKAATRASR